ncbi:unnamed protein product, partial [Scytosiphon promiscuus]
FLVNPRADYVAVLRAHDVMAERRVQVQIRYTRLDGTKCLRVLTKTQRVTKSKSDAEKSISVRAVLA